MINFISPIISITFSFVQLLAPNKFEEFSSRFVKEYNELSMAPLELSYVETLKKIKSLPELNKQYEFFIGVKKGLQAFNKQELELSQQEDYGLIKYESEMNLERINLELQWIKNRPAKVSTGGILTVFNGKKWYSYLLKRWVSMNVTPDQIFKFGLSEIRRANNHIEQIRLTSCLTKDSFYKHLNDSSFLISDTNLLKKNFESMKATIYGNLDTLFNKHEIPPLSIQKGTNTLLAQTPGYYDNNVFYYNLFAKPYNKRQMGWLFLHEAVPGHHYQFSISTQLATSPVQQLFFYLGFAEGWASYTEELGKELGLYQTIYDVLGKWEWDLVRSVRVPIDVGINYYGWSDQQALAFWKKNIPNQDDIAIREIKRIRRWPAQVVTYKYGASQINKWKARLQKEQGRQFNVKDFHDRLLSHGTLPLLMLYEIIFEKTDSFN